MQENRNPQLQSAAVKQIMNEYFLHAAPLLCCRASSSRTSLLEQLLDLILQICDARQYRPVCAQIMQQTEALETVTDGLLLNMEECTVPQAMKCYFDMKLAAMCQPELPTPTTFDVDMLPERMWCAGASGVTWALRLGACLNWLGVGAGSSRENAVHIWRMLCCTGDHFAMLAMEHALRTLGNTKEAAMWKETRTLCNAARSQFLATIPPVLRATVSPEAANMALLIVSVRSSLRESNGYLPLPMLQYAADSQDPLPQKIRHLCGSQATFQLKLVQEQQDEGKQYGF